MWKPRLAALVLPLFAAGGCFYFDEINQRPSAQIVSTSAEPVYKGDPVTLLARVSDPDGDFVSFRWRAYACLDASNATTCEEAPGPGREATSESFSFEAPRNFTDSSGQRPTESMLVRLEAFDELGANALPMAVLTFPVLDRLPTVTLSASSSYESVEDTPIELFALVGDDDDEPDALQVTWTLTGFPVGSTNDFVDAVPSTATIPDEPMLLQHGKVFTPHDPGTYTFEVTAKNPLSTLCDGAPCVGSESIDVVVGEDRAPCIAQTTPAVSPIGALVPLTEPTLFRVPFVSDDLDGFPAIPADPIAGAPTFSWSVKAPGQPSYVTQAGVVGNSIAFDPAAYALGDVVDVRVEIEDRKMTPVNCPVGDLFCSTISSPACVQRVTWRVEVR